MTRSILISDEIRRRQEAFHFAYKILFVDNLLTGRGAIRRARVEEADALTALTMRSKAYWGYDSGFLSRAKPDLTFRAEKFGAEFLVFVLEARGRLLGFYGLVPLSSTVIELYDLFVEPDHIGHGAGKLLWSHAVRTARSLGFQAMALTADPHAEAFYKKRGATTVGYVPSTVEAGRNLPRMEYQIQRAESLGAGEVKG